MTLAILIAVGLIVAGVSVKLWVTHVAADTAEEVATEVTKEELDKRLGKEDEQA